MENKDEKRRDASIYILHHQPSMSKMFPSNATLSLVSIGLGGPFALGAGASLGAGAFATTKEWYNKSTSLCLQTLLHRTFW